MPAIVTHDLFGKEVYGKQSSLIGSDRESYQAFLLGNQGPDPLFFVVLTPLYISHYSIGITMHEKNPTELLSAFKASLSLLSPEDYPIGKAYVDGFFCHYLLDNAVHPLVYAQQYTYCQAGVDGLDMRDEKEVHHLIESEIDEMMLFTNLGCTISTFNPAEKILHATPRVLDIVSKLYAYTLLTTYQTSIPPRLFGHSVLNYRVAEQLLHSKDGAKRAVLSSLELLIRRYSMFNSLSMRNIELAKSTYTNDDHKEWVNPFTDEKSTKSFHDIYDQAILKAYYTLDVLADEPCTEELIRSITHDINFRGEPTQPIIVNEE